MYSVNFILGKREREALPTRTNDISKSIARWEDDGRFHPPIGRTGKPTTYYANAKIFSRRTERDEKQAVGKLYKGYIGD